MQRVLRQNEKIVKSKVKKRTMLKMALNELFLFKKNSFNVKHCQL